MSRKPSKKAARATPWKVGDGFHLKGKSIHFQIVGIWAAMGGDPIAYGRSLDRKYETAARLCDLKAIK